MTTKEQLMKYSKDELADMVLALNEIVLQRAQPCPHCGGGTREVNCPRCGCEVIPNIHDWAKGC